MESEANKSKSAESEEEMEVENGEEKKKADIRRYHCEFCGISRSKRSLITSHIQSVHPVRSSWLTPLFIVLLQDWKL
jgi:hypothetical protein